MKISSEQQQAWGSAMQQGKQSFQQGRIGDAVQAFTRAAELWHSRVESWVNPGSALVECN